MINATFDGNAAHGPRSVVSRSASALRSLMQSWEQESPADEEESETDLMVLLSGMVSPEISLPEA